MTLATVPRYDPEQAIDVGTRVVVIGAGMAGLLAARVLADGFEEVVIVERDSLPEEPTSRRGVPQSQHIHVLLRGGQTTLEDLFEGFSQKLVSAGGVSHDAARDLKFYMEGDFLAEGTQRRTVYSASRPLYEHVVRQLVTDLDDVRLRPNCQFTEYLVDDAIEGVSVTSNGGGTEELTADLVVDATGRTSRTPTMLDDLGYPTPSVDEVHIDVAYSSTFLERSADDRQAVAVFPVPGQPRGGVYVPVEDDRYLMTLWGVQGEEPPTDPEGVADWVASLPIPHLEQLFDEREQISDIAHYPFPSNLRRRYGNLDRFPDGLVVIGDGIASFNPIYGQGMSVAAFEAIQLHHTLAEHGLDNLALRYFDRIEETVDVAWNLAVGSDHQFPGTQGPKPRGTDILNWYLSRFIQSAHTDGELRDDFLSVQMMERPPTTLFRPRNLWRVFKPTT